MGGTAKGQGGAGQGRAKCGVSSNHKISPNRIVENAFLSPRFSLPWIRFQHEGLIKITLRLPGRRGVWGGGGVCVGGVQTLRAGPEYKHCAGQNPQGGMRKITQEMIVFK